jgi:WD40 repeat protein
VHCKSFDLFAFFVILTLTISIRMNRTPGQQLRLFDIRVQRTELHTFGWKQEVSDSQSALIDQTWSQNGYYIASGSTDPKIHIFDIRYNSKEPSQSIKAHQKRVLKAAWHHTLPLLISISSDLNIGLHRYAM